MDYPRLLGVSELARTAQRGCGVKIAILDSGLPHLFLHGGYPAKSSKYGDNGRDSFGHASEVSSILFGCADIDGVCPRAESFYDKVLDDRGHGSVRSVVKGIYRAMEWRADVINLSLGFARTDRCPKALEQACQKAYDAGISIICAAGNDGERVNWPAALPTTICVGSSNFNGVRASFSSMGEVDFLAPGMDLKVRDASCVLRSVSGTSYSAALVTGVVALLMSDQRIHGNCMHGPEDVRNALKGLAQDVEEPGRDDASGYGVISGLPVDTTVEQKIETGFFDKIVCKIQGLLGLGKKGVENGRV